MSWEIFWCSFVWRFVRKISDGKFGNFTSLGKFSLPSKIDNFLTGYYIRFQVCCAKMDFAMDLLGHVCCKIIKRWKWSPKLDLSHFFHVANNIQPYSSILGVQDMSTVWYVPHPLHKITMKHQHSRNRLKVCPPVSGKACCYTESILIPWPDVLEECAWCLRG